VKRGGVKREKRTRLTFYPIISLLFFLIKLFLLGKEKVWKKSLVTFYIPLSQIF